MNNDLDTFIVPASHRGLLSQNITTKIVSLYGAGHLGSWIAYALCKLGIKSMIIHDFDSVEERNLSGSPYPRNKIGLAKNKVLRDIILDNQIGTDGLIKIPISLGYFYAGATGFAYQAPSDFYILTTDNAESRLRIAKKIYHTYKAFKHVKSFNLDDAIIIDARSNGPAMAVLTIPLNNPELMERYFKDLEELALDKTRIDCNASNIIQVPFFVASIAAQVVSSFTRGYRDFYCYQGGLLEVMSYPYRVPTKEYLPPLGDTDGADVEST